ncbi:unnamed protein product [Ranitomeya imitator]|uniref:Helix-turn-helix domain-containing protein n=1 Tax=Ranitomeya imitator TaxID=111125 RepID=A0ABN9MPF1_9NEOB|nr:unnamed protein product [Ranitomeya imitator]
MTTRQLRVRILEHVRDIRNGASIEEMDLLKTIPKHFRQCHHSNPNALRVKGIDRVQLGIRGAKFDYFTIVKDLELFARKLSFKKYFLNRSRNEFPTNIEQQALADLEALLDEQVASDDSRCPTYLHGRSQHFPPTGLCTNVDIFLKLVKRDMSLFSEKISKFNLTRAQNQAIKELKNMKDIVIKPADKGGNVVLWPADMYEREAFRQLNMTHCYKKLANNPLNIFKSELDALLQQGVDSGVISVKMMKGLQTTFPKIPTLYLTPKVHKNLNNPPGRPIVAGIDSLTENISRFIDFYLQQCVETLPSFVKDTTDVLKRLSQVQLEHDMFLVVCDVEALYTSICHDHGIAASRFFLNMTNLGSDLIEFILDLLHFSLTHNFFVFKDRYFLQLQGTAMGATCAPSYANLFLGLWEREVVHNIEGIDAVVSWSRYIDDILFIWQGSEISLNSFLNRLNANAYNIHLTWQYSREGVDFLDISIHKGLDGYLSTDVYRKVTATNTLLHATSSHHPQVFKSIPISQFLRMKRICSDESGFEKQAQILTANLKNRGYNRKVIRAGYRRAKFSSREQLLSCSKRQTAQDTQAVRLITGFNSQWREIMQVLGKHWAVLRADDDLASCIPKHPSVTWRRSKNLKDILTKSHYVAPQVQHFSNRAGPKWGSFQCGDCSACKFMDRAFVFNKSDNSRSFTITHNINCKTDNVIYFAYCPCGLIYIGMTTRQLRVRILEHVRDIRNGASIEEMDLLKTIPKHFRQCHHSNPNALRVKAIDRVQLGIRGGDYKKELLKKESKWMVVLDTIAPRGLNEYVSFKPFL